MAQTPIINLVWQAFLPTRELSEDAQSRQAIAIALGCSSEPDGKDPIDEDTTLVTGHRDIKE